MRKSDALWELCAFTKSCMDVASAVSSQQESSLFESRLRLFYVELACSPSVCMGSLRVLRCPPTVHKHTSEFN